MFIARSSTVLILFALILQRSYLHPATQGSLFLSSGSLDDTFDPSANLITGLHEDGNFYLDDSSGMNTGTSGSDDNLFADYGDTAVDSNELLLTAGSVLVFVDDDCLTPNGGLPKRDGASCPTGDASLQLTLPAFQESPLLSEPGDDSKNEDENPTKTNGYDMNRCSAHGIFSLLNRVIDVCCDGPRGPWRIDRQTRLIYDWIKGCRIGTSSFCCCNLF